MTGHVSVRNWVRFASLLFLYPLTLFLAAGRLRWTTGWCYVGVIVAVTMVSRVLVARKNPDLLAERAHAGEGAKDWDRALVLFVGLVGPLTTALVAGLNVRFSWRPTVAPGVQWSALGLVTLGGLFTMWAMVENRFFSAIVRIQHDRGHRLVSTGPYAWVRHPGYAGALIATAATPFALSSSWAALPALMTVVVLVARTALEDRTLLEELPGYAEYRARTRYRLLPGVW